MPKDLPSPELLRKLLRYDPDTGKLFWRERGSEFFVSKNQKPQSSRNSWNAKYANKEAFTATSEGYFVGSIFDTMLKSHRVIWAMEFGRWPEGQIDHINGCRSDNRIVNLREVSSVDNCRNCGVRSDNSSGVTGLVWIKSRGKWRARVWNNGRAVYLGEFRDKDAAISAVLLARNEFGYHENHGQRMARIARGEE